VNQQINCHNQTWQFKAPLERYTKLDADCAFKLCMSAPRLCACC